MLNIKLYLTNFEVKFFLTIFTENRKNQMIEKQHLELKIFITNCGETFQQK